MMAAQPATSARGLLAGLAARLRGLSRPRRWASLASALWVVVVVSYALGYFSVVGGTQTRGMLFVDGLFFLIALVLPLMLIWLAAWLAEEMQRQREVVAALAEFAAPLLGELEATRAALEAHRAASPEAITDAVQRGLAASDRGDALAEPLVRIATAQVRLQASLDALTARGGSAAPAPPAAPEPRRKPAPAAAPRAPARTPPADQPALPLLPEAEASDRLAWDDLIRALDFPRDGADREGFRALEAALKHQPLAQMLQAAEDVLTLLSQQGVYMEDLPVTPGDPEHWRRFIAGARGAEVASLGGITDAHALETARALAKSDPIFRDTALFFQRRFDTVLCDHALDASDAQIIDLADTRSGRAFMLLARFSGALG